MQRVVSQKLKRTLALATVAAAALLAGCGGGSTQQIDPFAPTSTRRVRKPAPKGFGTLVSGLCRCGSRNAID